MNLIFETRSRENYFNKYRTKIHQNSPASEIQEIKKKTAPVNLDKIHNHGRQYEIYNESNRLNNDHSFSHPHQSVNNQQNGKENRLLNQTIQPYYAAEFDYDQGRNEFLVEEVPENILNHLEMKDNRVTFISNLSLLDNS